MPEIVEFLLRFFELNAGLIELENLEHPGIAKRIWLDTLEI
jgi:hypothetical protein